MAHAHEGIPTSIHLLIYSLFCTKACLSLSYIFFRWFVMGESPPQSKDSTDLTRSRYRLRYSKNW